MSAAILLELRLKTPRFDLMGPFGKRSRLGRDVRSDLVGKCIMRLLAGLSRYMTSPHHEEPNRMWVGREYLI
jgi:hypothetical protein